jgi:hypothetical protein
MERAFFIARGRERQSVKTARLASKKRLPQTRIKNRTPCERVKASRNRVSKTASPCGRVKASRKRVSKTASPCGRKTPRMAMSIL